MKIVYLDSECVVVNKPSGMPSHPLKTEHNNFFHASSPNSALEEICKLFPEISNISQNSPEKGLVHRLDTGTSGLLMFARSISSYKFLREAFSKGLIKKTYVALTEGIILRPSTICNPIAHHQKNKSKMVAVSKKNTFFRGKPRLAITNIFPLYIDQQRNLTSIRIIIHGGCRHQIRVHLASINHPIIGDALYDRHQHPINQKNGFCLHADSISLPYGAKTIINSPIIWDLFQIK